MNNNIAVIEYNQVQKDLVEVLNKKGFTTELISPDEKGNLKQKLQYFDRVILPFPLNGKTMPIVKNEDDFAGLFDKKQIITGGMADKSVRCIFEGEGLSYDDYFDNEAYVLKNAFITSQGAVRMLTEYTRDFLPGSKVLVTGYGRIGKSLSNMLKGLGMKVFVAARSETALTEAKATGFEVFRISNIKSTVFYYDYIFNTVPYQIFDEKDVSHMNDNVIYFELASAPYGADKAYFDSYEKKHIQASALPGKFYPYAVAQNIADYITANRR